MAYTGTASLDVYSGIMESTGMSVAALNGYKDICLIFTGVNNEGIHRARWLRLEQF
jgi:hypothetical protein